MSAGRISLRLPATSANLGPGFDAAGLAMKLFLEIEAEASEKMTIMASGRNADAVGSIERNVMLETYRSLAPSGPALSLKVHNEIPLGMGCGSSAAALLGGVLLADHFGGLNLTRAQILDEACHREGHPDNVATCFLGGFTVSSMKAGGPVQSATFSEGLSDWRLLLAVPGQSLSTTVARSLLPDHYSRADAVANVQATALLVAAFAQGNPQLLVAGTRDRLHQPFREAACPLLARLLPLAGSAGIHSVTLSGAGPSVLLILDRETPIEAIRKMVLKSAGTPEPELIETGVATGATNALNGVRQVT